MNRDHKHEQKTDNVTKIYFIKNVGFLRVIDIFIFYHQPKLILSYNYQSYIYIKIFLVVKFG